MGKLTIATVRIIVAGLVMRGKPGSVLTHDSGPQLLVPEAVDMGDKLVSQAASRIDNLLHMSQLAVGCACPGPAVPPAP